MSASVQTGRARFLINNSINFGKRARPVCTVTLIFISIFFRLGRKKRRKEEVEEVALKPGRKDRKTYFYFCIKYIIQIIIHTK